MVTYWYNNNRKPFTFKATATFGYLHHNSTVPTVYSLNHTTGECFPPASRMRIERRKEIEKRKGSHRAPTCRPGS